ncbi:hypothetical protein DH26_gp019 [Chloriridovirus anopheles1]|uniref:Uncharacterized protein n=1 Tax=Chloriridovirus anopheles1 TaxID=1465751 RepID=W8QEZ2_9VIRU|nr:hypothetical protein DH26_gp019 [Anopheles minimus iridovirus]AHL67519.1 hypothetical protein AMIV_019 [Anopheles minimus iridovirus]
MSINFKIYDPISQVIATGGGGGDLALSGGVMSGNIIMPSGTKISLVDDPVLLTDAANKNYVDMLNPVTHFSGIDPNITPPLNRPLTNGVIYMGIDNRLWVSNGLTYSAINGSKLNAFAMTSANQKMNIGDYVEFSPLTTNLSSAQGLSVTDSSNGSIFSFVLQANRPSAKVKLTVSIAALYSAATAKFFTFDVTNTTFTNGPGLVLDNNATLTSTHMYSEILTIDPGTTDFGIRLQNSTLEPIDIGDGILPLTYRWILLEEI